MTTEQDRPAIRRTNETRTNETRAEETERPAISAETMSPRMRYGLLVLTLLASVLTVVTMIAVFVDPRGVFALGTPGALMIGGLIALIWLLQLLFGATLENDPSVDEKQHRWWIAAFVLTGPIGLLLYWFTHVWHAPERPHEA